MGCEANVADSVNLLGDISVQNHNVGAYGDWQKRPADPGPFARSREAFAPERWRWSNLLERCSGGSSSKIARLAEAAASSRDILPCLT